MSKANAIKDRKTVADHVSDAMHRHWPSWSIDTLLTHPHEAIEMATLVLGKLKRPTTRENVHEVCRAALSSRKRGDLKRDRH
jgi:hypothetical protein